MDLTNNEIASFYDMPAYISCQIVRKQPCVTRWNILRRMAPGFAHLVRLGHFLPLVSSKQAERDKKSKSTSSKIARWVSISMTQTVYVIGGSYNMPVTPCSCVILFALLCETSESLVSYMKNVDISSGLWQNERIFNTRVLTLDHQRED